MADPKNDHIPYISKNTNRSTFSLFEARKYYSEDTIPYITGSYLEQSLPPESTLKKIPFSDLYKQNAFYGIVDIEEDIILPINVEQNFKSVGSTKGKAILLQNFVADALQDMNEYLKIQKIKNNFVDSPYINLKPKKAYYDFDSLHGANVMIHSNFFKQRCLANKQLDAKVTNFNDFVKEFIKHLTDNCSLIPFTRTSNVSYFNFSYFTSGLAFNFSDDSADDDVNKYTKYFLDPAFICFSEACVRFGFKFDKRIPFVLLADINSPAMKPYMERYDLKSVQDLFEKRFKKVYFEEVDGMKFNFYNCYKYFLIDNEIYAEDLNNVCSGNANKIKTKTRKIASVQEELANYKDTFWMRLYVYLKNIELGNPYDQQQFENLVRTANEYVKLNKTADGIKFISSRFSEIYGVEYHNSLRTKNSVIQVDDAPVGVVQKNRVIF